MTNNPAIPRVRVPVTVEIESALSVTPPAAMLGEVPAGTETERKVIVRGLKPFRIVGVRGTGRDLSIRDSSPGSNPVHVLTVTIQGTKAGDVNRTFHVVTDVEGENDLEFTAEARIVP